MEELEEFMAVKKSKKISWFCDFFHSLKTVPLKLLKGIQRSKLGM